MRISSKRQEAGTSTIRFDIRTMPSAAESAAVACLRNPETIRARCRELLALAEDGALTHFRVHRGQLDATADLVLAVMRERYPDLDIPFHSRWRHFHVGGIDRWKQLSRALAGESRASIARTRLDLVVTSVLLDAGAGDDWRYREPGAQAPLSRSEGLAVASFHMFSAGAFSSDAKNPLRADAPALTALSDECLERAFQVSATNPLVGVAGRSALLRALGRALGASPDLFGAGPARVGHLYDYLAARAAGQRLAATEIFTAVLRGLAPIWPGRLQLGGENLGDVWHHVAIRRDDPSNGLIPFHKLSQWLTYSMVEPLEEAGLRVTGLDALTGLAEYRNGGLLVDRGVLALADPDEAGRGHDVGSELVVEWRALTVALLDAIAERIRARLGVNAEQLPLIRILEGGTWAAGRRVAQERRSGGGPPIAVTSDGTVF
jgi:Protein of unknown function (DUF1688)